MRKKFQVLFDLLDFREIFRRKKCATVLWKLTARELITSIVGSDFMSDNKYKVDLLPKN